ncbi:MAG: NAD(P)/FAD-dependent oxidoreductase [Armatimonadota bacterium]|nr:NAD(P)/FAD-dependent oxidoreductase [Armatimonadota bacterium]MDR7444238.1 NAD(P)/FAD-dependent oxidoreductase [Armatimonadota bacterium]MDR7570515.1 NAD(P)/FAD-dependent oxidoreductase [Armatimonadota bacterium]MDR7614228.1 NAD(P)/FAD-dependent oxidoreductase [Armatimonadota bacterium]
MKESSWDVIVVGAGPAGGMAAWTAARMGLRVLLLEEHPVVGDPTHCAGKLSVHAFAEFGIPQDLARTALRAATVYSPEGRPVTLRRQTPDSYVVDRDAFDRWLVQQALASGAELLVRTRACAVTRDRDEMVVEAVRDQASLRFRAPVVVDAEGARARLATLLGVDSPRRMLRGLQYQVTGIALDEADTVEVYLGRRWAPGFFAWLMPLGEREARIGVCVDPHLAPRPPAAYLEDLLRNHPALSPRARGVRVVRRLGGWIPLLLHARPTYAPGFLVVGDAAGHVKATSGGGIYYSLVAGRLAAQAAARYLSGARGALRSYEQAWRARFGREVTFTAWMRRALDRIPDEDVSRFLAGIVQAPDLQRVIGEYGDTQYQSRLFRPFLTAALRAGLRHHALARAVARTLIALLATR